MKKILLAGAAALVIGAAGTGALIRGAEAQRAESDAALEIAHVDPSGAGMPGMADEGEFEMAQADAPPGPPGAPPGRPWMRGGPGGPGGHPGWHRQGGMMRMFSLFYRPADRALTPDEVQKIAEAFLLWNGNRTWKVTQVADGPDGVVTFAYATADGGVIAKFSMNKANGRVRRIA
jgi:hypothetical protein